MKVVWKRNLRRMTTVLHDRERAARQSDRADLEVEEGNVEGKQGRVVQVEDHEEQSEEIPAENHVQQQDHGVRILQ